MTLQITKLPKIEWQDCLECDDEADYQIENMFHGALTHSCEKHLLEAIKFEMHFNQEN